MFAISRQRLNNEKDKKEAKQFVEKNSTIPTGFVEEWIAPYALMGYTKDSKEQGEWAARAALEILDGKPVSEIPVTANKKANILLNMRIAQTMNIRFPLSLIRRGKLIK